MKKIVDFPEPFDATCTAKIIGDVAFNWYKPAFYVALLLWLFTCIQLTHSRMAYRCVVEYAAKNDLVINKGKIQQTAKNTEVIPYFEKRKGIENGK